MKYLQAVGKFLVENPKVTLTILIVVVVFALGAWIGVF